MVDTFTYNPNHSEQVRKILANATPEERQRYLRLSWNSLGQLALGFLIGLGPMMFLIITKGPDSFAPEYLKYSIGGLVIGVVMVLNTIRWMRRSVRRMLVSFEWAREQGITEDKLQLDDWG